MSMLDASQHTLNALPGTNLAGVPPLKGPLPGRVAMPPHLPGALPPNGQLKHGHLHGGLSSGAMNHNHGHHGEIGEVVSAHVDRLLHAVRTCLGPGIAAR